MFDTVRIVTTRHWLPIVTFCPVNHLPDVIYASVEFVDAIGSADEQVHELYGIRRRIRKLLSWRKDFMEVLADDLFDEFKNVAAVEIRLAFNRHVVRIER